MSERWIHTPSSRHVFAEWGDERVYHDLQSGDTHLVSHVDAFVLTELEAGTRLRNELVAEAAAMLAGTELEDVEAMIDTALNRLARIGLIACEPI